MILLDANVLLYAYNADAPEQRVMGAWLKELLAGTETIGLPWVTIWAFLRISTNHRLWLSPLSAVRAFEIVNEWLAQPGVVQLTPGPRHFMLLHQLVVDFEITGALMTDAVLAAVALENGATVASTDQDFRRFPTVKWIHPLRG